MRSPLFRLVTSALTVGTVAGLGGAGTAAREDADVQGRVGIGIPVASRRAAAAYPSRTIAPQPLAAASEVQHVVVYLKHAPPGPAAPVRVAIRQRGETFLPRVVAVPVGSEVAFPNEDHIYHNVFSLSRARTFNLGRYPFGRSGSVRVDTPGVVKVFCDIHSHMSATVLVFNHPWFAVPDAQGRFALDEYEQIKQHPALGARILREVPFLAPHLPIVELHHERPDGKGYPHGLTAEAIPLDASIVHVADAFDAMTGARAYRPARPAAAAIEELRRHMGTQFDAASVEALGAALRDAGSDAAPPAANVLERAS